jgi:magnesium-transporting ATPase (P-type)
MDPASSNSKDSSDYHCKDAIELCEQLGTNPSLGLSAAQVEANRRQYGNNKLPEPKRASKLKVNPICLKTKTKLNTKMGNNTFLMLDALNTIIGFHGYYFNRFCRRLSRYQSCK